MFQHMIGLWLSGLLLTAAATHIVDKSQDFPKGAGPENLVLRPSGNAIVITGTVPQVYQVNSTANARPELLHEFQDALGVSSLAADTKEDTYYLITGNYSLTTLQPTPASYSIHRMSFDQHDNAVVQELAPLDQIAQPNGMIYVPDSPYVLIADCYKGLIFRFNTETLELDTYFDNPLLKPQPADGLTFGVNGVKLSRGYLYFSNTNQELVARIKATGLEPCLRGSPEIVATQAPVDDFIVNDYNGDLYLAYNSANALGYLSHDAEGTVPKVILGGGNSTAVLGPAAAIWAKDAEGEDLLVTVSGGFEEYLSRNFTHRARVEKVQVGGH